MSFFKWTTDDSTQMISPWIAIYFALTILVTGATIWRWRTWTKKEDQETINFVEEELGIEKTSISS